MAHERVIARAEVERAAAVLADNVLRDAPLGALTTYRVGGRAALFVQADDERALALVAAAVEDTGLPVLLLGKGSNLLVADRGFPGIAVRLGAAFEAVSVGVDGVSAGGAATLPVVARRAASAGLRGLEWAVGVPGSVGGAVRMNAGGHGSDVAACLASCRVSRLSRGAAVEALGPDGLAFAYRRSNIGPNDVVVEATFRAGPGRAEEAEALVAEIVRWRRANQPGGQNAGSVFTNPPAPASAGALIDRAGCKGLRHGSAVVSLKHANFIQADEGGRADDVLGLMEIVRAEVLERTGVSLDTEIRLVGFPGTYPDAVLEGALAR